METDSTNSSRSTESADSTQPLNNNNNTYKTFDDGAGVNEMSYMGTTYSNFSWAIKTVYNFWRVESIQQFLERDSLYSLPNNIYDGLDEQEFVESQELHQYTFTSYFSKKIKKLLLIAFIINGSQSYLDIETKEYFASILNKITTLVIDVFKRVAHFHKQNQGSAQEEITKYTEINGQADIQLSRLICQYNEWSISSSEMRGCMYNLYLYMRWAANEVSHCGTESIQQCIGNSNKTLDNLFSNVSEIDNKDDLYKYRFSRYFSGRVVDALRIINVLTGVKDVCGAESLRGQCDKLLRGLQDVVIVVFFNVIAFHKEKDRGEREVSFLTMCFGGDRCVDYVNSNIKQATNICGNYDESFRDLFGLRDTLIEPKKVKNSISDLKDLIKSGDNYFNKDEELRQARTKYAIQYNQSVENAKDSCNKLNGISSREAHESNVKKMIIEYSDHIFLMRNEWNEIKAYCDDIHKKNELYSNSSPKKDGSEERCSDTLSSFFTIISKIQFTQSKEDDDRINNNLMKELRELYRTFNVNLSGQSFSGDAENVYEYLSKLDGTVSKELEKCSRSIAYADECNKPIFMLISYLKEYFDSPNQNNLDDENLMYVALSSFAREYKNVLDENQRNIESHNESLINSFKNATFARDRHVTNLNNSQYVNEDRQITHKGETNGTSVSALFHPPRGRSGGGGLSHQRRTATVFNATKPSL